jgi:hypothetical protein
MYIMIIKVMHAIIIVRGKYSFECKLEEEDSEVLIYVKYKSNPAMASGMMSSIAIEMNKLPEKVIATDMI